MTEPGGEGVTPSPSLLAAAQRISALNVFARAFPAWVRRHGTGISITLGATPDGAAEISLGMPGSNPAHLADEFLDILEQCQRMADLEAIVSELRACGVDDAKVQNYVVEAQAIAHRLFPK